MYIQSYPRQKFTLPQLQQAYGDFLSNRATMSATFVQILCSVNIIEAKTAGDQLLSGLCVKVKLQIQRESKNQQWLELDGNICMLKLPLFEKVCLSFISKTLDSFPFRVFTFVIFAFIAMPSLLICGQIPVNPTGFVRSPLIIFVSLVITL